MDDSSGVGVYVHVPFCERICPYCDFAVVKAPSGFQPQEDRYVEALLRELEQRAPDFAGRELASLYFGGGTPSLLRPDSLARIGEAVRSVFAPRDPIEGEPLEVTLEVNPSTVERERLPGFRSESGVTRLSIGVQSFDDSLLKALGRAHRAEESRRTLAAARAAGFDNISLDLIFAALHQTAEMLDADLDEALAHAPEHVSTYELVLEERTPFGRAAAAGKLLPYSLDGAADMIERMETRLGEAGLARYELTNYARPGREAVHNLRYWLRAPVLGLGVGAHSTDPPGVGRPHGARLANPRGLTDYLERALAGRPTALDVEVPSAETARAEALFLGLRMRIGLDAASFAEEFGEPPRFFYESEIETLLDRGLLLEDDEGGLRLSARGLEIADTVFGCFV
jgi:oxygen-independent coproporphyrinogen-3 oxidase